MNFLILPAFAIPVAGVGACGWGVQTADDRLDLLEDQIFHKQKRKRVPVPSTPLESVIRNLDLVRRGRKLQIRSERLANSKQELQKPETALASFLGSSAEIRK